MSEKLLSERIEEDGITCVADMIGSAPYGGYEYDVTLHRPDGRTLHMHDYSGPEDPTALDAVGVMLSVASRVAGTDSYEEWAGEFASDPKDWQSREVYDLQVSETRKLRDFLGADFDAYVFETERDD